MVEKVLERVHYTLTVSGNSEVVEQKPRVHRIQAKEGDTLRIVLLIAYKFLNDFHQLHGEPFGRLFPDEQLIEEKRIVQTQPGSGLTEYQFDVPSHNENYAVEIRQLAQGLVHHFVKFTIEETVEVYEPADQIVTDDLDRRLHVEAGGGEFDILILNVYYDIRPEAALTPGSHLEPAIKDDPNRIPVHAREVARGVIRVRYPELRRGKNYRFPVDIDNVKTWFTISTRTFPF